MNWSNHKSSATDLLNRVTDRGIGLGTVRIRSKLIEKPEFKTLTGASASHIAEKKLRSPDLRTFGLFVLGEFLLESAVDDVGEAVLLRSGVGFGGIEVCGSVFERERERREEGEAEKER